MVRSGARWRASVRVTAPSRSVRAAALGDSHHGAPRSPNATFAACRRSPRAPFRLHVCDALRLPDRAPSRHQLVDHLRAKRFGECGVGRAPPAPVDDDPPTIVRPLWIARIAHAAGVTQLQPG